MIYQQRSRQPAHSLALTYSILAIMGLDCLALLFAVPVTARAALILPGGPWWTVLTYPLAADPLSLVFAGFWLYLAGGELEIRWGRLRYGLFLALSVPLSSLPLYLGASAFHRPLILAGFLLPLACLTVVWCLARLDGIVLFGFLLPIPVKVLLVLEFILVYIFTAMTISPLLAFLALAGPGLSYLYARHLGPDARVLGAVRRGKEKCAEARRPRRRRRLRVVKP